MFVLICLSYLRYLCLLMYSGVQHTLRLFLCCLSSPCLVLLVSLDSPFFIVHSVRLYLKVFVLFMLFVLTYSGVQHTLRLFLRCLSSPCVPCVVSFSRYVCPFFIVHSVFSNVYLYIDIKCYITEIHIHVVLISVHSFFSILVWGETYLLCEYCLRSK